MSQKGVIAVRPSAEHTLASTNMQYKTSIQLYLFILLTGFIIISMWRGSHAAQESSEAGVTTLERAALTSGQPRGMAAERHISSFVSVAPTIQETYFQLPSTHVFQVMAEKGDALTAGGVFRENFDFTGYVPINGSSVQGRIGLNHEWTPGGVSLMDVQLDNARQAWSVISSRAVDFGVVNGTARNCSGTVTPWETLVSCEEITSEDLNGDGYNDLGWCIEIDPTTGRVIDQPGDLNGGDKLWALGNFYHENIVIRDNERTVYQGTDARVGYLYKFVADTAQDLSSGRLYAFKDLGGGWGEWVQLANTTPAERNSVEDQAAAAGARVFSGIEDVEINPLDGKVYFAVKREDRVYRLNDIDPLDGTAVNEFETYVGNMDYDIVHATGTSTISWGFGNDNLAFDDLGNLWVMQDGDFNYIWLVRAGHTQTFPKVELFGIPPRGSEPTGITFTPDFKYLFMSFQHPSGGNDASTQPDAFGAPRAFDRDVTIVISRGEFLGERDYGDAPDSYGTNDDALDVGGDSAEIPATHVVPASPQLYLGSSVSSETDARGTDSASDTADNGLISFPQIPSAGSSYSLTILATNQTTRWWSRATATLYGWVDFDNDGRFQADELATAAVGNGNSQAVQLTWTVSADVAPAPQHHIRLRLTTDELRDDLRTPLDDRSIGPAQDGEVEDYRIFITTDHVYLPAVIRP